MPEQPLEYAFPSELRDPISPTHCVGGFFIAVVAGPGIAVGAAMVAPWVSNDKYAAIGGLVIGGITGAVLTVIALIVGVVLSRSRSARRRGLGVGLLVGEGANLLLAGACYLFAVRL